MSTSDSIPSKFTQIQTAYNQIIRVHPLNASEAINAINTNLQKARNARNRVRCGGTSNLDNLIAKLQALIPVVQSYKSVYDSFSGRYNHVQSTFSVPVFNRIVGDSHISQSTFDFLNSYEQDVKNVNAIFHKLKDIVENFTPQKIVDDSSYANSIFQVYG